MLDRKDCTGCFACQNICPKNAIMMVDDEYGFLYPEINKDICIDCGLCEKVCHINCDLVGEKANIAYAMWAKDENIHNTSASGGAAYILSKYVIDNGGIVYGAAFAEDLTAKHVRVDNINDLHMLQGSKYTQSYIIDSYQKVKKDLQNNMTVLFTGTPCQIAGLKLYLLNKNYTNLITIDLVCHGVPSQKMLKEEVSYYIDDLNKVKNISFRGIGLYLKFYDIKGNVLMSIPWNKSMYFLGFRRALFYRESCYSCKYAKNDRVSDITIGDFWGIGKDVSSNDKTRNGISLILPNTVEGQKLVDSVRSEMDIIERTTKEAFDGNMQLNKPTNKHRNRKKFLMKYKKYGIQKAAKICMKKERLSLMIKTNTLLRRLLNKK